MPRFQTHTTLSEIPASSWDALHDGTNPFIAHAFLHGLEKTGCLRSGWGWLPLHAALWEGDELVAAAPGYIKGNSHGEFVFDHAWAAAIERTGRAYYPKWLLAIPYTPVMGPRLLAPDSASRTSLCNAIVEQARESGYSSIHANFLTDTDNAECPASWLERTDVQFHWHNHAGWRTFDEFLAALQSRKRKNIRQERARIQQGGIEFRIVQGDTASAEDIATMHQLYLRAFSDKGNSPALTSEFFQHLATSMPKSLVLILAQRAQRSDGGNKSEIIAGALCLRGGDTLYGRYWGCFEEVPGLHFETCYYQGIEYCLREGLTAFEPGAQGEHKIARGFLPTTMHSRHHFIEEGIDGAFERWCVEERTTVDRYRRAVIEHSPYRADDAP